MAQQNREPGQPKIRLEHLFFGYEKQFVIEDFSLEINDREFVSIVGPSGCGKTTLLNMIVGLLQPTQGQIWLDNIHPDHPERWFFRVMRFFPGIPSNETSNMV